MDGRPLRLTARDWAIETTLATTAGPEATVVLTGELDVSAVPLLRARLRAVALTRPPRLVIDAAGITFIDCTAARVLLVAAVGGRPDWGKPVMRCPSPAVRLVLGLTGLADQCEISG